MNDGQKKILIVGDALIGDPPGSLNTLPSTRYKNFERAKSELLEELSKMDFLINLANVNRPNQIPSKLIDYSIRSGAPIEVVENLQELEDEGEVYESIEDIWPDYPSHDDFMFNEDEY